MIRSVPFVTTRPATKTVVRNGTFTTTKPALLVSTLMVPVPSRNVNQHPATGHFSISCPRSTIRDSTLVRWAEAIETGGPSTTEPSDLEFRSEQPARSVHSTVASTQHLMELDDNLR